MTHMIQANIFYVLYYMTHIILYYILLKVAAPAAVELPAAPAPRLAWAPAASGCVGLHGLPLPMAPALGLAWACMGSSCQRLPLPVVAGLPPCCLPTTGGVRCKSSHR